LNYLLTQLRDSLASTHAFLDNDEQGRGAAEAADGEGLLGIGDRTMAMCPGAKRDSEFEDLVHPSIYRQAFLRSCFRRVQRGPLELRGEVDIALPVEVADGVEV
jgi:hypothetical protein